MNVQNQSLIFHTIPNGPPIPGHHLTIGSRPLSLSDPPPNGFITKNLYSSLDPYMRLMLIPADQKHYRAPFTLNEPLWSAGLAEILVSNNPDFPRGSIIRTRLPIQQYTIFTHDIISSSSTNIEILPNPSPFHIAAYLGPLGMPGQTAYSSLLEIGNPQPGETIFISAASGAVGQLVGQISKLRGLRVIGSVGSQSKLSLIKTRLGFDDGFIYKDEDPDAALTRLCPDGIDIYFDNVGGPQLEAAIEHMNKYGRIIICGMISQYNKPVEERYGIRNLMQFVGRSLTMRGFLVGDVGFRDKWDGEFRREVGGWIEGGELEIVMSEAVGIERAAQAFVDMLEGKNLGKSVLRIWPDGDRDGEGDGQASEGQDGNQGGSVYRELKLS